MAILKKLVLANQHLGHISQINNLVNDRKFEFLEDIVVREMNVDACTNVRKLVFTIGTYFPNFHISIEYRVQKKIFPMF